MPLLLTEADRDVIYQAFAEAVRQRKEIAHCYLDAQDALRRLRPHISRRRAATAVFQIVMWRSRIADPAYRETQPATRLGPAIAMSGVD